MRTDERERVKGWMHRGRGGGGRGEREENAGRAAGSLRSFSFINFS